MRIKLIGGPEDGKITEIEEGSDRFMIPSYTAPTNNAWTEINVAIDRPIEYDIHLYLRRKIYETDGERTIFVYKELLEELGLLGVYEWKVKG